MFIEERHQKISDTIKKNGKITIAKSRVNTVYPMNLHAGICGCSNKKAFAKELTAVPFR